LRRYIRTVVDDGRNCVDFVRIVAGPLKRKPAELIRECLAAWQQALFAIASAPGPDDKRKPEAAAQAAVYDCVD
jgi:hypothetical protein